MMPFPWARLFTQLKKGRSEDDTFLRIQTANSKSKSNKYYINHEGYEGHEGRE
jgi:hypothetical protein